MKIDMKALTREIFLSLWKVHMLHHAGEGPVVGQWMLQELRRHGYEVSPGTMYPLLRRMERRGWLRGVSIGEGLRARRDYHLTATGRKVLALIRKQIGELRREMEPRRGKDRRACCGIRTVRDRRRNRFQPATDSLED
ncbi:MAG: helix-turn-helix transcriptional regulator [Planctomycetes bacterium]|nr:helix-turn-helix transcriptional regulator [Planctomycetota bacterium]